MTWTQADHDHLVFALGEIELEAFTSIREKDGEKRRQLAKDLRRRLETVQDIQHEAANAALYIKQRISWLEQS